MPNGDPTLEPQATRPTAIMLLGLFEPPLAHEEMVEGLRPSNDIRYWRDERHADIVDFRWLSEPAARPLVRRALTWVARRTGRWSEMLALGTVLRIRRYDIVYATGEDIGVMTAMLLRFVPGRRPYLITRVERAGAGSNPIQRFVHRTMMKLAAKRMDVVMCRSNPVAEGLRTTTPIPDSRIMVFGQEVDTRFFDSALADPSLAVEALADADASWLEQETPLLVSAGLEHRDYTTLLDAVDGLPVRVVIAAGSPWSKDRFGVDRELPSNVVVRAFGPRQMRALYAAASVVVVSVHPTDRSCGISVVDEAWSMARPVVVSLTDGLAEHLEHDGNCLTFPPGDAAAMRAAIEQVLSEPGLAARIAAAGRDYVTTRLSMDHYARAVDDAISLASTGHRSLAAKEISPR